MRRAAQVLSFFLLMTAALGQVPVHVGTGNATVRGMEPWRRALAATPDGSLWSLVWENDGTGTPQGQRLQLHRSLDSGASWVAVADTPTVADTHGALVAGIDCDTLHVAWSANPSGIAYDLFYQTFDIATLSWNGSPLLLLQGTNSNDQYYATDIEVSARGTVAVAFHCHRAPTAPGMAAWAAGLFVKRPADVQFQGPYRCNTDTYGLYADLQAIGEVFHASFRTNTGLYGIRYRAFDAVALQFVTPGDIPLYGASQGSMLAANTSCIAAANDGGLYVLFNVGLAGVPGGGEIRIAYAPPGSYGTWTHQLVAADADLLAGNVTYTHFGLACGDGGQVFAIYSKRTAEQHQNLYLRIYQAGVAVTPELLIATGSADQFTTVSGMRSRAMRTVPMATAGGTPAAVPQGLVQFVALASVARAVQFGTSCQGSLPQTPELSATTLPALGSNHVLGLTGLPAGTFGLVFAGTVCQRPPLPLGGFGMPGCFAFHDNIGTLGFVTDPAGAASLTLAIPANPVFADTRLYFGSFVLAPGANAAGAVTTNSIMSWFR